MRTSNAKLYVHLVWSTRGRAPLIDGDVEAVVHAAVLAACKKLHTEVVAIGGTEDHVHLLASVPTTVAIAQLAKRVKGSSSHLVARQHGIPFRWQGGYGAFTVSRWDVPRVARYVGGQKDHHREGRLSRTLEQVRVPTGRPATG